MRQLVPIFLLMATFTTAACAQDSAAPQLSSESWQDIAPEVTEAAASIENENQPKISAHEKAKQELHQEEKQRILGVVPNFNTSNIPNAAPLSPGQKLQLTFRVALDPFQFVAAALDAGYSQWRNDFPGYGRGGEGYAKRFGAAYADQFSGAF